MRRARTLLEQQELQRLLNNLGIGLYPIIPRSPPPPTLDQDLAQESPFSDCGSQVLAGWDELEAASSGSGPAWLMGPGLR